MSDNHGLCLKEVSFAYPKQPTIFQGLNLQLPAGKITALIGENGAGKTTLLKLLTGTHCPLSGSLSLNQQLLKGTHLRAYHQQLGYMPEDLVLYPDEKVLVVLKFLAQLRNKHAPNSQIESTLQHVGLWEHRDKKVSALSKGLKQRLNLAQAIVHQPQVAIFDEPSNGFDYRGVALFYQIIRELADAGAVVLITTHLFAELQGNVDALVLLKPGGILEHTHTEDNNLNVDALKIQALLQEDPV